MKIGKMPVAGVVTALAAALAVTAGPAVAEGETSSASAVTTSRLAGATRVETAVEISQHAFPDGAESVYLARKDVLVDAVAAGSLTDGPVLLVPTCGDVPTAVADEIARLDPSRVVALGGGAAVCQDILGAAAQGRQADRLAGATRYETAFAIARERAKQGPVAEVYIARGDDPVDAVAGGQLTHGPTLLAPPRWSRDLSPWEAIRKELQPRRVVGLGGAGAVDDVVEHLASREDTYYLAGATRYGTAAEIAGRQFRGDVDTLYLARGDKYADAVAAGGLTDGPVLLTKSCELPEVTKQFISQARPLHIVALGGPSAVCDAVLQQAAEVPHATSRLSPAAVDGAGMPIPTTTPVDMSGDGRLLLLRMWGDSLSEDLPEGEVLVLWDRTTGSHEVASVLPSGAVVPADAVIRYAPWADMTDDGRFVVFTTDVDGRSDAYLRDLDSNTTVLVPWELEEVSGSGDSYTPFVSADGRSVVLTMDTSSAGEGRVMTAVKVNMVDGSTTPLVRASDGSIVNTYATDMSPDGRWVVVVAPCAPLGDCSEEERTDLYRVDTTTGERVRLTPGGTADDAGVPEGARYSSYPGVLSDDGSVVALCSQTALTTDDHHVGRDGYIWRAGSGLDLDLVQPQVNCDGMEYWPQISGDGSTFAFVAEHDTLRVGDTRTGDSAIPVDPLTREPMIWLNTSIIDGQILISTDGSEIVVKPWPQYRATIWEALAPR